MKNLDRMNRLEFGLPPPGEVGRKRRLSVWSTGRKEHASSGGTKFKFQMAQSITDATSTDENGGT